MLQMLKSYSGTGKYVILDSGFRVLKALIKIKRHDLFACALIKKQCFWPTGEPGVAMDEHMVGSKVGSVDAIQGSSEGVVYNLWAMKEPDYVMKMMAMGGSLMTDDSCRTTSHRWIKGGVSMSKEFTYTSLFDNHFHFCMQSMITTTYDTLYLLGKILG